jgi:hypothetical protein
MITFTGGATGFERPTTGSRQNVSWSSPRSGRAGDFGPCREWGPSISASRSTSAAACSKTSGGAVLSTT